MRTSSALLAVAVAAGVTGVAGVTGSATAGSDGANEYVVVYKQGADLAAAHAAIAVGRLEDRDGNGTPDIDASGNPTTPAVVKQGSAYYQWIQGTSMAAPHAVGVAALIVAQYGKNDRANPGVTCAPDRVEQVLRRSAVDTPCPNPPTFVYPAPVPAAYTATCQGNASVNGFYGDGIVNAFNAVTSRR